MASEEKYVEALQYSRQFAQDPQAFVRALVKPPINPASMNYYRKWVDLRKLKNMMEVIAQRHLPEVRWTHDKVVHGK